MKSNMKFSDWTLLEYKKEDNKVVFVDEDGVSPFPADVMQHCKKMINTKSKDLAVDWKNAADLVKTVLTEIGTKPPMVNNVERWEQYVELLGYAVKNLHEARGAGKWTTTTWN